MVLSPSTKRHPHRPIIQGNCHTLSQQSRCAVCSPAIAQPFPFVRLSGLEKSSLQQKRTLELASFPIVDRFALADLASFSADSKCLEQCNSGRPVFLLYAARAQKVNYDGATCMNSLSQGEHAAASESFRWKLLGVCCEWIRVQRRTRREQPRRRRYWLFSHEKAPTGFEWGSLLLLYK